MEGLRFGGDGRAEVWGELRRLLHNGAVLGYVQGHTREEAVPQLLSQCARARSDGRLCDWTDDKIAAPLAPLAMGVIAALPRCACAAALAALHDVDPDEMDAAALEFIAAHWLVEA